MTVKEFENQLKESLINYYEFTRKNIFNNNIKSINQLTYNSQIRIGETNEHFIVELLGAKNFYPEIGISLSTRAVETVISINHFILGSKKNFDNDMAVLDFSGSFCNITGIHLSSAKDIKETESRIGIKIIKDGIRKEKSTIPLKFDKNSNNSIMQEVDLLRTESSRIYYRYIKTLIIVEKSYTLINFKNWLENKIKEKWDLNHFIGINHNSNHNTLSKSLFSLSEQNISERIIDKFISDHVEQFATSMGYKRALPQIKLKWKDKNDKDPSESIPDYIVESKDGYYHIIDLKKGFLGKDLVKGKIGRKRFIDYVCELIAQLKNYERYFDKQANRDYAKSKYGIEVNNNIKLIGIVGNYYEYNEEEVAQVLDQYDEKISIISYFDLASLINNMK
ncbi:hypothetical protein [Flavobacterium flavigenum]|uniref:hypothetical protein n=1 Tax=Flavobacterium flavigenum TaxID=3003258 RepID=UPI0024824CD0|nr:hypothetical protein [Flavobacterium flavigenum]